MPHSTHNKSGETNKTSKKSAKKSRSRSHSRSVSPRATTTVAQPVQTHASPSKSHRHGDPSTTPVKSPGMSKTEEAKAYIDSQKTPPPSSTKSKSPVITLSPIQSPAVPFVPVLETIASNDQSSDTFSDKPITTTYSAAKLTYVKVKDYSLIISVAARTSEALVNVGLKVLSTVVRSDSVSSLSVIDGSVMPVLMKGDVLLSPYVTSLTTRASSTSRVISERTEVLSVVSDKLSPIINFTRKVLPVELSVKIVKWMISITYRNIDGIGKGYRYAKERGFYGKAKEAEVVNPEVTTAPQ